MSDNERFKNRLPFHATFRWSVQVPVALLHYYRQLGLRNQHLVYVLEVFSTYMNGAEASQVEIAKWMQTDPRVLRQYGEHLRGLGFLDVTPRRHNGTQAENDYDFTPLLDAALALYEEEELEKRAHVAEIADVLREIAAVFENGQDVSDVLKRRVLDLQRRSLAAVAVEEPYDDNEGDDETEAENGARVTLVGKLERLGYDRRSASYLVYKAKEIFADDLDLVVNGWLKEIKAKGKKIRNPAGFLRTKLESGAYPPKELMDLPRQCQRCKRELQEYEQMVGSFCLECSGLPVNK